MDNSIAERPRATVEDVSITTRAGRNVSGALALPEQTPAPGLVLFHAFSGLTREYRTLARHYADLGFVTVAADLYKGKTTHGFIPSFLRMLLLNNDHALDTSVSWVHWLRTHPKSTGKVGAIGWCFGGAWALNTSLATPIDATVIYYGEVPSSTAQLRELSGPVLGHFAERDRFIPKKMVTAFANAMNAVKKDLTLHWYEAEHAFANKTTSRFDDSCAKLANDRTLSFLRSRLNCTP